MKAREFFSLFGESLRDLIRRPALIIPGLVLWLLIFVLSKISVGVNHKLMNSIHLTIWLVIFGLISLSLMSFVFSGLIAFSERTIKRKKFSFSEFIHFGKNYWFSNLIVMAVILVVTIVIGRAAHFLAKGIGERFGLDFGTALFIFVLIYFVGLISGLIWLTFGNFMVVLKESNAFRGIKASASLVKKEYLATLSLNVLLFVVLWFVRDLEGIIFEFFEYGLIIPYLSLVFSRFVLGDKK